MLLGAAEQEELQMLWPYGIFFRIEARLLRRHLHPVSHCAVALHLWGGPSEMEVSRGLRLSADTVCGPKGRKSM